MTRASRSAEIATQPRSSRAAFGAPAPAPASADVALARPVPPSTNVALALPASTEVALAVPAPATPLAFEGATIRLYGADILIVIVQPWILADPYESQLLVFAFRSRFQRTIVLVAQDDRRVPTYFGPAAIVAALGRLPFDALSWRRYIYRKPPVVRLPIPIDPPPGETDADPSWSYCATPDTDLEDTAIRSQPQETRDDRHRGSRRHTPEG